MMPVPSIEMDSGKQGTTAKRAPTKTKGATTKKSTTKETPQAIQPPTKKSTTKRKPASKKSVSANSTLPFTISKAAKVVPAGKGKLFDGAVAKAEPLAPSWKSNSQSPPEKTGIKLKLTPKQIMTTS